MWVGSTPTRVTPAVARRALAMKQSIARRKAEAGRSVGAAKQAGETDERLFTLAAWREAPYFAGPERAVAVEIDPGVEEAAAALHAHVGRARRAGQERAELDAVLVIAVGDVFESWLVLVEADPAAGGGTPSNRPSASSAWPASSRT